jgi:hypothetical protein
MRQADYSSRGVLQCVVHITEHDNESLIMRTAVPLGAGVYCTPNTGVKKDYK